jgi:hypothetical protein
VQPSLEWLEARDLPTATPTATPFFVLANSQGNATPLAGSGPSGYTPSQIVQAYGFNQISFSNGPNGTGQTIAIVDAYNDPNIQSDLAAFDSQFGLSAANLRVIGQTGGAAPTATDPTGGWELEESLDVEWAHAVAPGANIVLVEANSSSISDLMTAVQTAANLSGVSAVSMSWGANEFSGETSYDSYFSKAGVAFIGAAGDSGAPPIYPAASPNVLAVGGTTLTLNSQNNWSSETGWSGSGGGISSYESQPSYQKGVVTQTTTQRANPDVAYDANPNTGFAVDDSFTGSQVFGGPWYEVGGTSDAAPQWAGLVAIADQGRVLNGESTLSSNQLLTALYQMPSSNFHDITSGNNGYSAGPGYDLVTGLGTPIANNVVASLINGTSPSPPSPPPGPTPTLPVITSNPTSQRVPAGQTVTFTASASGTPTPTVQWEVSNNGGVTWSNISGATSTILTLAGVTTSMNGDEYEAVFTNSVGSVATMAATLTVTSPPPAPPPPPPPTPPPPPPAAGLLPNGSFEQPSVGSGYTVDPGGSPWSYFGSAGVAGNGSILTSGAPPAPDGTQVGFLHNRYSMISQAVNLTVGNIYTINFDAAQAVYGQTNNQAIEVFVNDTPVALVMPGSSYAAYNTTSFYVTSSGTYVITFVGLDPGSTAFLDDVGLSATPMVAGRNRTAPEASAALTASSGSGNANLAVLAIQTGLGSHDQPSAQGTNLPHSEVGLSSRLGTLAQTFLALQRRATIGPLGDVFTPDWLDPFLSGRMT